MCWLVVWRLRRARVKLQSEIDWIRETIWTDQIRLTALEAKARQVQAELWIAESPENLLPRTGGFRAFKRGGIE